MRAMWMMMQRQQLGGWLCLLAMVLHLLATLDHGCPRFDVAEASYSTGRIVETSYFYFGNSPEYEWPKEWKKEKDSDHNRAVFHFFTSFLFFGYSPASLPKWNYDGLNRPEVIAEGGRVTQYGYDLGGRAVILVAANAGKGQGSILDRMSLSGQSRDHAKAASETGSVQLGDRMNRHGAPRHS